MQKMRWLLAVSLFVVCQPVFGQTGWDAYCALGTKAGARQVSLIAKTTGVFYGSWPKPVTLTAAEAKTIATNASADATAPIVYGGVSYMYVGKVNGSTMGKKGDTCVAIDPTAKALVVTIATASPQTCLTYVEKTAEAVKKAGF